MPILLRVGFRYLIKHPWQSILMILGISLGVAVVIAIDIANASANRAFNISTETVAGKATHQITGGPSGLDESVYIHLRRSGLARLAAPVIDEYISSPNLGGAPLHLIGIDPFVDAPFRDYLRSNDNANQKPSRESQPQSPSVIDLRAFLTKPGAVLISANLASQYGVKPGQSLELDVAGQKETIWIAGLLRPEDRISRRALDGIVITDIATAQELTGKLNRLDRIDLILPEDQQSACLPFSSQPSKSDCLVEIQKALPKDVQLLPAESRSGTISQMTDAFRVNLTALSLLAMVVGMFLIYNTITFSVVQRRSLFGTLRCLGAGSREVFLVVIGEGLIIGILGAVLGSLLGIILGQGAIRLVTQTINDLFYVVNVRGVQIPPESLLKGCLLGVIVSVISAAPPAWEAATVPPVLALSRSGLERKARRATVFAAIAGVVLISSGILILLSPYRTLIPSFLGTFTITIGFALLTPLSTRILMPLAIVVLGKLLGVLGRMAPRNVLAAISRTAIAVMALMIAVSVTIGVSLMIDSFRYTVKAWLSNTLQGDIYLSAPSLTATTPSTPISPQVVDVINHFPSVDRVDMLRSVVVDSPDGPIHLAATSNQTVGVERTFQRSLVPQAEIWNKMLAGMVVVSEPLANRLNLTDRYAKIALQTDEGLVDFAIAGVYYDYASTQGTVLMARPVYQKYWNDGTITAIALRLKPGVNVDQAALDLQKNLAGAQQMIVRPNSALRQEVMDVFDRTFAITRSLQILAVIVAFIGILSSVLSLELERQRELGILRAVGMSVHQLWGLILIETGLLGAVAGILAMPTGYMLALILVYIINRRSFGWTLQLDISPAPFLVALCLAMLAALLAGIYPARRMGKMLTSEALRSE